MSPYPKRPRWPRRPPRRFKSGRIMRKGYVQKDGIFVSPAHQAPPKLRLCILLVTGLLVASMAVGPQLTEATMPGKINLNKRVFMLGDTSGLMGTGFRICEPNLVLTAAHVIDGRSPAEVSVVAIYSSPAKIFSPTRIERHPEADVAALFLNEEEVAQAELGCFNLGVPSNDYPGFSDYPLGKDILAYGFPAIEKPIRPRTMKGHKQQQACRRAGQR